MDASARCIELIHGSEGFKTKLSDGTYKSYLDTLANPHVWTIYCGLTKGVGPDTVWTVEECEKQFSKEMSIYENAIENQVIVPLNQNQFDALVSLVYNIGPGSPNDPERKGFYWSTLRKLLNQGKYEEAATQFKRYKYAGGVVYRGLVTRRAKEAALFLQPMPEPIPIHEEQKDPIPQVVDRPKPVVSIAQAVKESPTVAITAVGAPGGIYALWKAIEELLSFGGDIITQAGPKIIETQQSLSPFSAILKMTPTLLIAITVGTLATVAMRQIIKRRNGTAL